MAEFDDLIEAQLAGATVRTSQLVRFDFRSAPMRLWHGFGDLVAAAEVWQGLGDMGQISAIQSGPGQAAEEMTFTLFGSDGLLANLADDAEESAGRTVEVFLQFFDIRQADAAGAWVDWHLLSSPLAMFYGIMGPLTASRTGASAEVPAMRSVSVPAVNAFWNRSRPALAYFSDRDQKARSPDDNMFARVSAYSDGTVAWPQF